jgi:hypothetical protein
MGQTPLAESKPRFWWGLQQWLHTRRLREENGASGSVNFVWLTPEYETRWSTRRSRTARQAEWRRVPRANLRLDGRRAAAQHEASPQEGRSPGDLVPPRLDVGAKSERSVCRLEPQRQVRGRLIEAPLERQETELNAGPMTVPAWNATAHVATAGTCATVLPRSPVVVIPGRENSGT